MKNIYKFCKFGFTLIELLIVIAIIGILAVAFLPTILGAPSKARDTQRVEDVHKIVDFFTYYYTQGNALPTLPSGWGGWINPDHVTDGYVGTVIKDNIEFFNGTFPVDPIEGHCYIPPDGACNGMYMFINRQALFPGDPYLFQVTASMENEENGNYGIVLTSTDIGESGPWYTVLVQK